MKKPSTFLMASQTPPRSSLIAASSTLHWESTKERYAENPPKRMNKPVDKYVQVECYQRAVGFDQYLAIAYFQEGVSNFLLGDFEEALANFNDTLLYLRGNTSIDYEQLGLKFRLFSCEVLFNRGLCYIYLQQIGPGLQDLEFSSKEKVTPDHDVIDDAIRERAEVIFSDLEEETEQIC